MAGISINSKVESLPEEYEYSYLIADKIDVKEYISLLKKAAKKHKYSLIQLGKTYQYPILLLKPKCPIETNKNILIASGFHGDEIAGPFGVLRFLEETDKEIFSKANISFIPLVNPTGFRRITRNNRWDETPNRGYVFSIENADIKPSTEDKILLNNIRHIIELGRDGILSLHEDPTAKKFYCYTCDYVNKQLISDIVKIGKKNFGLLPKGYHNIGYVTNGTVYDALDGSFDHLLSLLGIPICTTETPGSQALTERIAATTDLINLFINGACAS